MNKALLFIANVFFLYSCGLEQNIDLQLPAYQSQLVVESYLEDQQSYRLLLSESVSFFEAPQLPRISDALVMIKYKGKTDTLKYEPVFVDSTRKFYNYVSKQKAHYDTINPYELTIVRGKQLLSAKTIFKPFIKLDSVGFFFNEKNKASAYIEFKDDPKVQNFYRRTIYVNKWDSIPKDDQHFTDLIFKGKGAIGTNFNYKDKDRILLRFYHINEEYYNFLRTARAASRANSNPFSEPTVVLGNIKGGLGIFTALSFEQKILVVKQKK